jgi:hypothetical protein
VKNKKCKHVKPDGKPCGALSCNDSDYCFYHDPKKARERSEAGKKGGKALRGSKRLKALGVLPPDAPDVRLESPEDIERLVAETISQVRRGQLAPQTANSVGYLVNILLKAKEVGDLDERLSKLEQELEKRPGISRVA